MRVLITGSEGHIGRVVTQRLLAEGHDLITFDRSAAPRRAFPHVAGDLRDAATVRRAAQGVDAIVHLGALAHDSRGTPEDIFAVNVQGTAHVLLAAAETGASRVVCFSSVQALGCFGATPPGAPLPIADDCPRRPKSPYQISKHLCEELCRGFTERYQIATPCLRPVGVWNLDVPEAWRQEISEEARVNWGKEDYWSYVDVTDVADAAWRALTVDGLAHDGFLLAADDTCVATPTAELLARVHPDAPWPGVSPEEWLRDAPHRGLIDTRNAREQLGWQPKRSWRDGARP